jgi:sigma-E factor negative regulatory protein RseA
MNTSKTVSEQISAFADGELNPEQQEQLIRSLREPAARDDWDRLQLSGDTLRSSESAVAFSAGFSDRMAARLAAEPAFLGAASAMTAGATEPKHQTAAAHAPQRAFRRMAIPGAALAATVLLAVAVGPRLHGAHGGNVASLAQPGGAVAVAALSYDDQTLLRNPQIDEYLAAHQRFSPSLYSTAQYARPSTLATESNK